MRASGRFLTCLCAALLVFVWCGDISMAQFKRAERAYVRQLKRDIKTLAAQIKQSENRALMARVETGQDTTIAYVTLNPKAWRKLSISARQEVVRSWWKLWRSLRQRHEKGSQPLAIETYGVEEMLNCYGEVCGSDCKIY